MFISKPLIFLITIISLLFGNLSFAEDIELKSDKVKDTIISEKQVSQIFEEASRSVVVITARKTLTTASQDHGFIVAEDGVIVTTLHLVAGAKLKDIQVNLRDSRKFSVKEIIDCDRQRDICVIKIDTNKLPILSLGDSDKLVPGQKILVINSPAGSGYAVCEGLFVKKERIFETNFLQINAYISGGGGSGAPVLDMQGKVVGIISGHLSTEQGAVPMAIPINEAKKLIHLYSKINPPEFDIISRSYVLFQKGVTANQSGDYNSAFKFYKKAAEVDPNYAEAHAQIGFIYGRSGKLDEAIIELRKAINLDPNIASAHANLGNAYVEKGMLDEAIFELKKGCDLDPSDSLTYINLSKAFYLKGKYDFSIYYCDAAIKLGAEVEPGFLEALKPYRK